MQKSTEATYKIGLNRGRKRIWIDGPRLKDAGFVGGTVYYLYFVSGGITCRLKPLRSPANGSMQERKVTGRPDGKPIIDITGKTVEETFQESVERVHVTFERGLLTIKPACKCDDCDNHSGSCQQAADADRETFDGYCEECHAEHDPEEQARREADDQDFEASLEDGLYDEED